MLSVQDLTKRYGDLVALDGVSFEVQKGDILGFLGKNGAGKSTTMKIVTGFVPPSSGTALVDGWDVRTHSLEVRRRIGYLPEHTPLYTDMRVREYLEFRARLKGVARRDLQKRLDYAIEKCWLKDRRRQVIGTLSKGYRQRVGIADALVADPKLLILDEPTIGLDPTQIQQVRGLIKELGQEHTIVLSTHILVEVEMVCSKVVMIRRGRTVAQDTVEGLIRRHRTNAIRVSLRAKDATLDEVEKALREVPGITRAQELKAGDAKDEVATFRLEVDVDAAGDAEAQVRAACERTATKVIEKGWTIREIAPERTTLEQVFNRLTDDEAQPALVGAGASAGEVRP